MTTSSTRSPHIGKNQRQNGGGSLSFAALSAMCENFMLSMTRALQHSKNKSWPTTQKEHYFPSFPLFHCLRKTSVNL